MSDDIKTTPTGDDPLPAPRHEPEFTLPLAPRGRKAPPSKGFRVHGEDALELRRVCLECSQEVFKLYEFPLELHDEDASTNLVCTAPVAAIIGFGGEDLRGTLTVVAPFRIFQASHPSDLPDTAETAVDVLDWAGELSNQLLGYVKTRLLARGVELVASIPRVMLGNEFRVPSARRSQVCELRFRSNGDPIGIWVEAIATRDTPILAGKPEVRTHEQGDVLLF